MSLYNSYSTTTFVCKCCDEKITFSAFSDDSISSEQEVVNKFSYHMTSHYKSSSHIYNQDEFNQYDKILFEYLNA